MVKFRRGWYLKEMGDIEEKIKYDRENEINRRQITLMKQCDNKIALRRLKTEQQKACEKEILLHAQKVANLKQKEIEMSHRLAVELSQRKDEEVRQMLKSGVKRVAHLSPSCTMDIQSRLAKEKVHLQSKQEKLLNTWHQDESFKKLQQAEKEKKKQNLFISLQNQMADNRRYIQEKKSEKSHEDRKMIRHTIQEIHKEDAKIKKKRDNAILNRIEMTAFMAIKNAWEKQYKEALQLEDEKISRIIAEKEAQQKEWLDKKLKLRTMKEAIIDKVAKKLLDNIQKETERENIRNELYQEEQMLKCVEEPAKLALRKQYAVAENLKEIMRREQAIAECKAKDDAINNAAFVRYLLKEREKDAEKQINESKELRAKKIQYGKELKEIITNNRVSYAMNIVERQSEIAHNHLLIKTSKKEPNDRSKECNKSTIKKEVIKVEKKRN